jgi:beta-lactamase regulating signal transducer with metallopeptidase domain
MDASAWLLGLALRSTLVLAVALGLEGLLRRKAAGARHLVLTLAAVGLLLTPLLSALLPRWPLPLVPRWVGPTVRTMVLSSAPPVAVAPLARPETELPKEAGLLASASRHAPVARVGESEVARSAGSVLFTVWLLGGAAALLGLARALRSEERLRATTRPLSGPWLDTAVETSRAVGLSRTVPLLISDAIETPLTSRWPSPAVLLPTAAEGWSDERRRVVVEHELVHLARGDAWRLLAWRLVAAVYWFHPLARLAERHARLVGEQACDEAVLRLGTRPSTYARHLMEIAESLRVEPRRFAAALPMVDRGQLERRLLMILDTNRSAGRGRVAAAIGFAVLAATVVAVSVAAPLHVAARATKPAAPLMAASQTVEKAPRATAAGFVCIDGRNGSYSTFQERDDDGGTSTFALQERLGDGRRLCARVRGPVSFDAKDGSIRELGPGSSVLIETGMAQRSQRMRITPGDGAPRYEWWLNGEPRAADDAARAWLRDALQVVAARREIGSIQGHVGSLQGEIGGIQGEIGGLQGEIGAVQGRIGGLQGALGSLQGEQGGLQGAIGGHQGAIGGLEAARSQASSGLRSQIDAEIETHRAAIRKLEAELQSGDLSRRMANAEAELRREEAKSHDEIAALERKIEAVKADEKIQALEKQIEDIDADERIHEIEKRMKPALDRLKDAVQRLSS